MTVAAVKDRPRHMNICRFVWQPQLGPSAWIGPQNRGLEGFTHLGKVCDVLVFTNDQVETPHEFDL